VIKRVRDSASLYIGELPHVESHFELRALVLSCESFPASGLNREFKLSLDENGKLSLAEGSIAQISEHLLGPILFNKLADWIGTGDRSDP
jgi:hypothetical protein